MEHEFSNGIFPWLVTGGGVLLLVVVGSFVVGSVVERRLERLREAEADAILLPAASTVAERPVEEIALDGADTQELPIVDPVEAWLADVGGYRRRDLADLDETLTPVYELAYEGLADPADHAHNFAELAEMAARPLATAVDATETREWPQAWEDELADLLAGQRVPA